MEQENKAEDYFAAIKKNNKSSIFFFILIVVGFTIYTMFAGGGGASLEFADDFLRLASPDKDTPFEYSIRYDEIIAVETITKDMEFDLGEMVNGSQAKKLWCGTWKNDKYGEYTLYASPKFNTYSVITTTDDVIVMNVEGDETTASFTDAMIKLLVDEGYWSSESGK